MAHLLKTDVLVVGAGPVGMLSALLLARDGLHVTIIDKGQRATTHSYACALHSEILSLLAQSGLISKLESRGTRIERISFFDIAKHQFDFDLRDFGGDFPYLLSLPQSLLESALEDELASRYGISVNWNYRFRDLVDTGNHVEAQLDHYIRSGKGYIAGDFDWEVAKTIPVYAAFLIGADGHDSHVRECLGLEFRHMTTPSDYDIYEFEAGSALTPEMQIAIHEQTSALWPLNGQTCRAMFEFPSDHLEQFPVKDRSPFVFMRTEEEEDNRAALKRMIDERAPFFTAGVGELDWAAEAQFECGVVSSFGSGRCWLAGDAAHQSGPISMQSMNSGLRDGADLVRRIKRALRESAPESLNDYNAERQAYWQQLFSEPDIDSSATEWTSQNARKIAAAIPASGEQLHRMLKHIGLGIGHFVTA